MLAMPWNVFIHPENPIIETQYIGGLSPEELSNAFYQTVALAEQHKATLFIADCSQLTGGHSLFDLYELIKVIGASDLRRSFKEALLLSDSPLINEDVKFWETACRNQGLQVKVFQDRQAALDWLLQTAE